MMALMSDHMKKCRNNHINFIYAPKHAQRVALSEGVVTLSIYGCNMRFHPLILISSHLLSTQAGIFLVYTQISVSS